MLYLDFHFTLSMREALSQIQAAREDLDPYTIFPYEFSGELRRTVLAESVHYSTRIEGNTLTLEQVETALADGLVNAPRDQIQEVENYRDAISFIQSMVVDDETTVTGETIRTIHFLVSKNLSGGYGQGRYRSSQNFVVDRITRRRVFFPPQPQDVGALMSEFVDWLNSRQEYPAPIKAALAHLNLVAIHPFIDGNGRTARVLESLVMYLGGFKSQDLVSLEAFYGQDNQRYYTALASSLGPHYSPPKDVSEWLEYHLMAHAVQAQVAVDRVREMVAEIQGLNDAFGDMDLTEDQIGALWFACRRGRITNRDYRNVTGRSSQGAISDFNALIEKGLIERVGRGRSTAYLVSDSVSQIYFEIRSHIDEGSDS